jgi:hypothetical protein
MGEAASGFADGDDGQGKQGKCGEPFGGCDVVTVALDEQIAPGSDVLMSAARLLPVIIEAVGAVDGLGKEPDATWLAAAEGVEGPGIVGQTRMLAEGLALGLKIVEDDDFLAFAIERVEKGSRRAVIGADGAPRREPCRINAADASDEASEDLKVELRLGSRWRSRNGLAGEPVTAGVAEPSIGPGSADGGADFAFRHVTAALVTVAAERRIDLLFAAPRQQHADQGKEVTMDTIGWAHGCLRKHLIKNEGGKIIRPEIKHCLVLLALVAAE